MHLVMHTFHRLFHRVLRCKIMAEIPQTPRFVTGSEPFPVNISSKKKALCLFIQYLYEYDIFL